MRNLKPGVIEPKTVPMGELGEYFASTYAGYLGEVQNRLWQLEQSDVGRNIDSGEFQKEIWAIQLRICVELLCFAVVDFDQVKHGLLGSKQRSKIDLDTILKKRKDGVVWPLAVASTWDTDMAQIATGTAPLCAYELLKSPSDAIGLKGRLDNIVHGQRRPRKEDAGHLSMDEIHNAFLEIKSFGERQLIRDADGNGWFVDLRTEFRKPTGKQTVDFKLFFIDLSEPHDGKV